MEASGSFIAQLELYFAVSSEFQTAIYFVSVQKDLVTKRCYGIRVSYTAEIRMSAHAWHFRFREL